MARPYPKEFRDDVVRVARGRDVGVTIEQIAADFGVHPITLSKWMRQADIDEGTKSGTDASVFGLRSGRIPRRLTTTRTLGSRRGAALSVSLTGSGRRFTQVLTALCGQPALLTRRTPAGARAVQAR
jgi:transposase